MTDEETDGTTSGAVIMCVLQHDQPHPSNTVRWCEWNLCGLAQQNFHHLFCCAGTKKALCRLPMIFSDI